MPKVVFKTTCTTCLQSFLHLFRSFVKKTQVYYEVYVRRTGEGVSIVTLHKVSVSVTFCMQAKSLNHQLSVAAKKRLYAGIS